MSDLTRYLSAEPVPARAPLRLAISGLYLADETALIERLLAIAGSAPETSRQISRQAADLVRRVRLLKDSQSALDAFMREYDLSSDEGVLLMCLAEALLRIPDDDTAERLIADKLSVAAWEKHLGGSDSLFVNASTWGLLLSGQLLREPAGDPGRFRRLWSQLLNRSSEPVIRAAVRQAMRMMGSQFVMGRDIGEALQRSQSREHRDYRHSFDMLGEAALTADDAQRYFQSYRQAIAAIGAFAGDEPQAAVASRPGISVKLSALHPRYEPGQRARVLAELTPKLLQLAQAARQQNIGLTIDAEEAERLELSLDLFEAVYRDPSLEGWEGLGLVVQAFQKRSIAVIEWLQALAREVGRRLPLRLVKGAYWDTEIKRAQEQGLPGYPVFTRKASTDVAYLACARRLLAAREHFYPQFATHNAHTVAAVRAYAGDDLGYEFQRLHGMGEALYEVLREDAPAPCRVYAPVGSHEDLLPYLVRRLLENGANTSFVNRIFDEAVPPEQLVADPVAAVRELAIKPNPALPLPIDLYGGARRNSAGLNLADETQQSAFAQELRSTSIGGIPSPSGRGAGVRAIGDMASAEQPSSAPFGAPSPKGRRKNSPHGSGDLHTVTSPADRDRIIGQWQALSLAQIPDVVSASNDAHPRWNATPVETRATMLERASELLEQRRAAFVRLLILEAGKTVPDAIAELREAVDFLRYYAVLARRLMAQAEALPGPTGEHNELQLHGRGVFVCISPWNFPLAIFTGQIAAALVTGNTVIAKPAEQTSLVAVQMLQLLHEAGIPADVLQCALGAGETGAALVADPRIAGVAFTGSLDVAQTINRSLADRRGSIATLIAETGGQNVMIVDSSALPEQVVKDAMASAFHSAGQRCSALRLLFLQEEIADKVIAMLRGAMRELVIGDPAQLATDVGPVIDEAARDRLLEHAAAISSIGKPIEQLRLSATCSRGVYFAPLAVEIEGLEQLHAEHFGPILHVARFPARGLEQVIESINRSGYGLTLGMHSRIESNWRRVQALARVGNCYINRGMTGAVVGVQPFGGEGLSGTGPKAGGPHYLLRFVTERTLTVNTAAVGGNARLLSAS